MDISFEERYQTGDTPWVHKGVDFNLVEAIEKLGLDSGRVLEIGCGTGDEAIWLAQQGFEVTGYDLSETAIEQARSKASSAEMQCTFCAGDFLEASIDSNRYAFAFDRGCLHSIPEGEGRATFVQKVADGLTDQGLWLSLVGNADAPPRDVGPPRLTAAELTALLEPCFEILSLKAGPFGGKQEDPPKAWICLMKKRTAE